MNLTLFIVRLCFKQIENQITTAKQDIVDVAIEISEASKSLKLLEPKIKKAKDNLLKYENEVSALNEDMVQSRQEKDSCQQQVQDARIKLIELESRRDQLKFKKASGDENSIELSTRQKTINKEIEDLKDKKQELDNQIVINEGELQQLNAEIQKQRSILDLKQTVYRETFQNIEEIQTRISTEQRNKRATS